MSSNFEETKVKQEQKFLPDLDHMTEQDETIQRFQEEFGRMAEVMREMVRRQNFLRLGMLADEAEAMSGRIPLTLAEETVHYDYEEEIDLHPEEVDPVEVATHSPNTSVFPLTMRKTNGRSGSPILYEDDVKTDAIRNFVTEQNLSVTVIMEATGISRSALNRWISRSNEGTLSMSSKVKLKNWFHEFRHGDGRTYTNRRFPEEINMLIQEEVDKDRPLNFDLLTALWQRCNSFSDAAVTRKQVRDKYNKMKKKSK